MNSESSPSRDPVVEEIREIRRRLWQEAGNDVQRFIEMLDRDFPRARPAERTTPKPGGDEGRQK
jgi:hypothetical protein